MQVAVVQVRSNLDRAENRGRAVLAVREAAGNGAGLVVLPEAAMCAFGDPRTDLVPLAEPLDGPFVAALTAEAAATGATVVAGTFEPSPARGRVFNTVVAVGPGGPLGSYRKLHLYDALGWRESGRVAAGDPAGGPGAGEPLVVPVGDLRVGVMTCYDLRFPEVGRALVDRGATVLAVPAAWVRGPDKVAQWTVLLRARAIESTAYVVAAAQPGPEFSGHSMIVDPGGELLGSLDGEAEGPGATVAAEVRAARVAEVRAGMPVLAHRRYGVVPRPASPAAGPPPAGDLRLQTP